MFLNFLYIFSNTSELIKENDGTRYKFVSFFFEVRTLCVKDLQELEQRQKKTKLASRMKELERKYQDVLTNLTQRYIANVKKSSDVEPVTEDDLNEIKQDISAFRYEPFTFSSLLFY